MSFVKRASIWGAMLIPPVIFYALLARSLTGLPFADDYDTILRFLLQWRKRGGSNISYRS